MEERVASLQNAPELDDAAKSELLKRYKAAMDWLANADEARKKTAQYDAEVQQAPQLVQQAKASLAESTSDSVVQAPPDVTLPQLEQTLAQAEAQLSQASKVLDQREEEIKRRVERKTELSKAVEETKHRLEESKKQLTNPPPSGESVEMTAARRMEIEARIIGLEGLLALYKAELKRVDGLSELFPLQRDLAKREKNALEKVVAAWQQIVTSHRKLESERQAREARRQVESAHPALRELAERNANLAEQRQGIAGQITNISSEVTEIDRLLEQLKKDFQRAGEKVSKAGHSATVGLMLRKQRDKLPSLRKCDERLRFVGREMPKANLERMELEEERAALGDMESALPLVLSTLDLSNTRTSKPYLEQTARELLTSKRDVLDKLVNDYDTYLGDLSELEVGNRGLIDQVRVFSDYIDEHVLWIRSSDRIGLDTFSQARDGFVEAAQLGPWIELAKTCGIDAVRRPMMVMAVLLAAVVVIVLHARINIRARRLCESKSGSVLLSIRPTLEVLLLASVAASKWPMLAAYFGWRMMSSDPTTDLAYAVGSAVLYAATLFWLAEFVRHISRSNGLAESHFSWSAHGLAIARRELRWLTCLGLPLAAVVVGTENYQQGDFADSIGRLAFIGSMFVLASFAYSILGSKENILRAHATRNEGVWLKRVRAVSCSLGMGVPIVLAALASFGYYYSALHLAVRLQMTMAMLVGLILAHAVGSRWFLVKRRNLAIQQARRRQQEAQAQAENQGNSPIAVPVDQHPDLSAIHGQLQLFLRHAFTVAVLVGSWFVWSDVLPALRVLDRVVLWEETIEVVETHEDAAGKVTRERVPADVTTTLRHALIAAIVLVAAVVLARNLPALLEITVLSRLPLDRGGRHAVSMILRYTVALAGLILACRTLNISWSSVQWLAAGMTVGLGFGLQEIFANLVSGLILLCERPIRVGDVITLGDTTGTVTNIRIRATTVTNWDRKELIVPNKELITQRLLNWTLSDTTNRLVIAVGVAYKSDPEEARSIMLEVLTEHPNVLDDPQPHVTFEGFGDSALNFVIRAFLASMDVRLATIHELHSSIHRRLNEAGIEIAFPQRDLNIRSVPQQLAVPQESRQHRERAA